MSVIVYSITNCPKCAAAKALLKRKEIPFEDFNVQEDQNKNKEMIEKLKAANLLRDEVNAPVLDIDGIIIEGFDKEKMLTAFKEKELLKE